MHIYPNSMTTIETPSKGKLVDIIMRTKDRPILLVRALSSILNQSYPNWHFYIENDGADSEKLETILDPYRKKFSKKLTVIHNQKKIGMEGASNCALKQSKGDFVVVHDDEDDSWHPDFLMKTNEFLQKTKLLLPYL